MRGQSVRSTICATSLPSFSRERSQREVYFVYKIAVVEDEPHSRAQLCAYLEQLQREQGVRFLVQTYEDGARFLDAYNADCDVILMDIEMPHMNGMKTARELRKIDEDVCLIFVTRMVQYAVDGYEVRALDFVVKPVRYENFSMKIKKALEWRDQLYKKDISLHTAEGIVRLQLRDVYYIEVYNHTLIYHTRRGDFAERGKISEQERLLAAHHFVRCNNSYLVNLFHVEAVSGSIATVAGRDVPIGRTKRRIFMDSFNRFLGAST